MQAMCDKYRQPFEDNCISHPDVRVYELSLLDRTMFRILRAWMERNLRNKLDKPRHVRTGNCKHMCIWVNPCHNDKHID